MTCIENIFVVMKLDPLILPISFSIFLLSFPFNIYSTWMKILILYYIVVLRYNLDTEIRYIARKMILNSNADL